MSGHEVESWRFGAKAWRFEGRLLGAPGWVLSAALGPVRDHSLPSVYLSSRDSVVPNVRVCAGQWAVLLPKGRIIALDDEAFDHTFRIVTDSELRAAEEWNAA